MKLKFAPSAVLLALLVSALPSRGATRTWISGSGFWTFTNNWVAPGEPTAADDVVFDSVANGEGGWIRLNGGPAGLRFRSAQSLSFLEGAGSYLIDGNTGGDKKELLLGAGGIANWSSSLQVFDVELFVADSQVWNAIGGDLWMEGNVALGPNTLTLSGDHNVNLMGEVAGSGNLVKEGLGTLTLGAPASYLGTTTLSLGRLRYLTDQTLPGGLTLNGGVLDANNRSLSFGTLTLGGDATLALGEDGVSQSVSFSDAVWNTGTFTILNWSAAPGSDQVRVLDEPSQTFLDQVTFEGYAPGAQWVDTYLVPVPEPAVALLWLLGLLLCWAARRRALRPSVLWTLDGEQIEP